MKMSDTKLLSIKLHFCFAFLQHSLLKLTPTAAKFNEIKVHFIDSPEDSPGCLLKFKLRSSHCGLVVTNLTSIHEVNGLIPGLTQWANDLVLL